MCCVRISCYRLRLTCRRCSFFFFFNDPATTEIYTLSLHDALPIYLGALQRLQRGSGAAPLFADPREEPVAVRADQRSEEHTSELQSQSNLVCRLLLEKKKNTNKDIKVTAHIHQHRRHSVYGVSTRR